MTHLLGGHPGDLVAAAHCRNKHVCQVCVCTYVIPMQGQEQACMSGMCVYICNTYARPRTSMYVRYVCVYVLHNKGQEQACMSGMCVCVCIT